MDRYNQIFFPQKLGQFFPIFKNGQGSPTHPPAPPGCVRDWVLKKVQEDNVEQNLVSERFISGLWQEAKIATGWKMVKPNI